jgi:two-component system, OmpR family, response regulator
MRLLIVEDDKEMREALTELMTQSGYVVDAVADGGAGLQALLTQDHDLAVVDLGLPRLDGLDVIRSARRRQCKLPILIITARDAVDDRVSGLDAGADDYLGKPFELREFEARVRALLRRQRVDNEGELRVGPLLLLPGNPRITIGDAVLDLPTSEFALLELLASRPGRVVSKDKIAERLMRGSDPPSDTAIEICVHRLRRKLAPFQLKVRTLRGFGYLLEVDESG